MGMSKFKTGDAALVIFPPKSIREKIDKWRRLYDPYCMIILSHITISYPFMGERVWRMNRDAVASTITKFAPFKVSLRQTYFFNGKPRVLWLRPEDGGELNSIHESLKRKFPKHVASSGFEYIPHLSIGFFDSVRALRSAWHVVSDGWKPAVFKVDRIYHIVYTERGRWSINDTLALKRKK